MEVYYDWYLKYPKEKYTAECWEPLYTLMCHTDGEALSEDSALVVLDCFYEDNLVEYAVFAMSVKLLDNFMHNSYLSVKNATKSAKCWITPWDMDGSLGRDGSSLVCDFAADARHVYQSAHPFRPWYDNHVQPFWNKYITLWAKLHNDVLSSAHVRDVVDRYTRQIEQSGAWKRERGRWNCIPNYWLGEPIYLDEKLSVEAEYIKGWYARNEEVHNRIIESVGRISGVAGKPAPATVYRIDGTRVRKGDWSSCPRGVYIVGGRKMVK